MFKRGKNYVKLVGIFLGNDKKITAFSCFSLIIGFAFLLVVSSLSGAIIKSKQKSTIEDYGKFVVLLPMVSDACEEKMRRHEDAFYFEEYGMMGDLKYEDTAFSLGSMKEDMGEILGFEMVAGKWPQASKQIVVEEYVLELLGIEKNDLPERIPLTFDEERENYEITGVISNYSYQLDRPVDADFKGNVYPSIICGEEGGGKASKTLVVVQKELDFQYVDEDINLLWDELANDDSLVVNNHLYADGYKENKDMIQLRGIYVWIMNLVLLLEQIQMIRTFFVRNSKTIAVYKALGMSEKSKRKVFLGWLVWVLGISILMAALLALGIGASFIKVTFGDYASYYNQALAEQLLAEVVVLVITLFLGAICYFHADRWSLLQGIIKGPQRRQGKYGFKRFCVSIAIIQFICIMFATASFVFMDCFQLEKGEIEYALYSYECGAYHPLKAYALALSEDKYITFDGLEKLNQYQGVASITRIAETRRSTLLIKKEKLDSYFKKHLEASEKLEAEDKELWEQVSKEASKYSVISSTEVPIVIVPDKEFQDYLIRDGIEENTDSKKGKQCILRLPNYEKTSKKASIKEKQYITYGGIWGDKKKAQFCVDEFQVASIESECEEDGIQILVSEETARKSKVILGYAEIRVSLEPDISASVQSDIEMEMNSLRLALQGSMLDTTGARNERTELIRKYTTVLSNTMLSVAVFAIWIYIGLSIYVDWEKNRHEYGVLRSFGMSYGRLQKNIFASYMNSLLLACVIGYVCARMIFKWNGVTNLHVFWALAITVTATYLGRIVIYFINKGQSISRMVNEES